MVSSSFKVFLLFVALLVAAGGCGRSTPKFRSAYGADELAAGTLSVKTPEALRSALADRTMVLEQLWVRAGVVARHPGGKDFITTTAMYRAPGDIRLKGSRLEITLFDLLIRGDEVALLDSRAGVRYEGTLADLSSRTAALGGLSPRELVSAMLAQSSLLEVMTSGRPFAIGAREGHFLVAGRIGGTQLEGIWLVRQEDALVREFVVKDGRRELFRVRFAEWRLEGKERKVPMPSRLELIVRDQETRLEIDVDEYRLEPNLRDAQFNAPSSRRVRPLLSLGEDASL